MTSLISTFRKGGIEQWPIGVISGGGGRTPIDGQRTVITVRRPGPCGLVCTL